MDSQNTLFGDSPLLLLPPPDFRPWEDRELQRLVAQARTELGELKGYCESIPNPKLLLSPAVMREALVSSEIEGIHTSAAKALQASLLPEAERNEVDKEVLRYNTAVWEGYKALEELPISNRLIRRIHEILVPRLNGEFRAIQNYTMDNKTNQIIYTPPSSEHLPALLANLEKFINEQHNDIDPLIAAAVVHYQFEAIHPFLDGNGRVGRIIMVLQLVKYNLLKYPVLFLSGYINKNRKEYYNLLRGVTDEGRWLAFCRFIVDGIVEQSRKTKRMLLAMRSITTEWVETLKTIKAKIPAYEIGELFLQSPVQTPSSLKKHLGVSAPTATRYLSIIATNDSNKHIEVLQVNRNKFYMHSALLQILHDDDANYESLDKTSDQLSTTN